MRYNLFFALFIFVVAPHFTEAPLWVAGFTGVIAAHAYLALSGRIRTISTFVNGAFSLIVVALIYSQFKSIIGPEPSTSLLIILAALKLEELRAQRDGVVFLFLLALLTMNYLLFSQSILATLYMIASLIAIATCFVAINTPREHFKTIVRSTPRLVSKDLLISFPIFLILFLFFPRFSTPWASLLASDKTPIGFSDFLKPGEMASLAKSKEPAFYATFVTKPTPALSQLYWRGILLEETDGWNWRINNERILTPAPEQLPKAGTYTIRLEPRFNKRLFALESTISMRWSESQMYNPMHNQDSRTFGAKYPVVMPLEYEGAGAPTDDYAEPLSKREIDDQLKIPPPSKEMKDFIKLLKGDRTKPNAIAQELLYYFSRNGFQYSLTTPNMTTVDEFLFKEKVGFCEHYASAFAAIMRWSGVPARVVSGFQGGEENIYADFILVRDQHAHTWTEIYDGERWVRKDPTASVNSVRISFGSLEQALPDETDGPRGNFGLTIAQVRMAFSAVEQRYNEFIMNYNFDSQDRLLNFKGAAKLKRWLLFFGSIVGAVVLFFIVRPFIKSRTKKDPVLEAYYKIRSDLIKSGIALRPSDAPLTVFSKAAIHWPTYGENLKAIASLFSKLKYENDPDFIAQKSNSDWAKEIQRSWSRLRLGKIKMQ